MPPLTYASSGVDYDALDAFKRACQQAAASTSVSLAAHGLSEPAGVRGESAYLVETPSDFLAHVEEGLGTKNLVADAMLQLTGRSFYRNIGIDTVATIVNDLITCGALPISVAMHAAVGDSAWFSNAQRARDLADGFAQACCDALAVWGGGETPALKGIVNPGAIVLAGTRLWPNLAKVQSHHRQRSRRRCDHSSRVIRRPNQRPHPLPRPRRPPATGISHTHARRPLLWRGPPGSLRDLCAIRRRLSDAGLSLHYTGHITGHGWRKLMRLDEPFVYRLTNVRPPLPIFDFLMKHGPIEEREAYATFNMGAGFAAYVPPAQADHCVRLAREAGYDAWIAGTVHKEGHRKAVEIEPLGITFEGETLQVR